MGRWTPLTTTERVCVHSYVCFGGSWTMFLWSDCQFFLLWGFPCFRRRETCEAYRGQASNCLVLTWGLRQERGNARAHTHTRRHTQIKSCQNSGFVCFEWFPWSCYVLFRLHGNSLWFSQGWYVGRRPSCVDARACVRRKQPLRET